MFLARDVFSQENWIQVKVLHTLDILCDHCWLVLPGTLLRVLVRVSFLTGVNLLKPSLGEGLGGLGEQSRD